MKIVRSVDEVRAASEGARETGKRVGFVPTMGNLHQGHVSLVLESKRRTGYTVASIFVNPFQFGESEDFSTYPRTPETDNALLADAGVDLLFLPEVTTIYPHGPDAGTRVEVPGLGAELCGATRPHFFRGVCTVVAMLLNIVRAEIAFFGEKDYQQLIILKRMARDLHLRTDIVGMPTVREADGLAMSSRNSYLDERQRVRAPDLYRTLKEVAERVSTRDASYPSLEREGEESLRSLGFVPEYVSVRSALDLSRPGDGGDLIVLAAVWLGKARLIDNVRVSRPAAKREQLG